MFFNFFQKRKKVNKLSTELNLKKHEIMCSGDYCKCMLNSIVCIKENVCFKI